MEISWEDLKVVYFINMEVPMKIFIYKYTNKLNGHSYIGKTNNVTRRKGEHLSNAYNPNCSFYNSLWCKKIRQYGYENFDFSILEETDDQHWREREKYWIAYYNTFLGPGYNRDGGGNGEDNRLKSLTPTQEKEVKDLLINSNIPQFLIAGDYNISQTLMANINTGHSYYDSELTYPLRKNYKTFEDYKELINDIQNTTITFEVLSHKYNCGYSTVKKINEGRLMHQDNLDYPLRKVDQHQAKAIEIKHLLKTTNLTYTAISKQVGCSLQTVRRINTGISHYDSNEVYPLR